MLTWANVCETHQPTFFIIKQHFTSSNRSFLFVPVRHCRLPVCHLSHPELFGQNGDRSVPRQNRPQLAAGAGRLHICQGKHHHNRGGERESGVLLNFEMVSVFISSHKDITLTPVLFECFYAAAVGVLKPVQKSFRKFKFKTFQFWYMWIILLLSILSVNELLSPSLFLFVVVKLVLKSNPGSIKLFWKLNVIMCNFIYNQWHR